MICGSQNAQTQCLINKCLSCSNLTYILIFNAVAGFQTCCFNRNPRPFLPLAVLPLFLFDHHVPRTEMRQEGFIWSKDISAILCNCIFSTLSRGRTTGLVWVQFISALESFFFFLARLKFPSQFCPSEIGTARSVPSGQSETSDHISNYFWLQAILQI